MTSHLLTSFYTAWNPRSSMISAQASFDSTLCTPGLFFSISKRWLQSNHVGAITLVIVFWATPYIAYCGQSANISVKSNLFACPLWLLFVLFTIVFFAISFCIYGQSANNIPIVNLFACSFFFFTSWWICIGLVVIHHRVFVFVCCLLLFLLMVKVSRGRVDETKAAADELTNAEKGGEGEVLFIWCVRWALSLNISLCQNIFFIYGGNPTIAKYIAVSKNILCHHGGNRNIAK